MIDRHAAAALAAAALFGVSTPLLKPLTAVTAPQLLAGLLYLGSGVGLGLARTLRDRTFTLPELTRGEWCWLAAAIVCGGVLGPVLLLFGLARLAAAQASLLLNLEAVLTALLAWLVFRESTNRRVMLGMALIVAGGVALAWPQSVSALRDLRGVAAIAAACLCWAADNNLTRKVANTDALFIAGLKGATAGTTNFFIALAVGDALPTWPQAATALLVGALGYGLSLALFVIALRGLGSARTGAYFATAPFIGAAVAVLGFHEATGPAFWSAALLMALGVWLHLSEDHDHAHTHDAQRHTHAHRHDDHHRHAHAFAWDGSEPHTHDHAHTPLTHTHAHYPDAHHRHGH